MPESAGRSRWALPVTRSPCTRAVSSRVRGRSGEQLRRSERKGPLTGCRTAQGFGLHSASAALPAAIRSVTPPDAVVLGFCFLLGFRHAAKVTC